MVDGIDIRRALGVNASIPYTTIKSSGPPVRPLEFPAPTVDRAMTVSADIIDHRTGIPFRATSVLMRRPIHAKTCSAARVSSPSLATGNASFDSKASRYQRTDSYDGIHSWHCAFNAPSSSLASEAAPKHQQHRRVHSNLSITPKPKFGVCGPSCDLPSKAYLVLKKLCNTAHGSVRLCVVLKRVSRNIMNYARTVSPKDNGFNSLPNSRARDSNNNMEQLVPAWETTDELVAIKVVKWSKLQSLRGRHLEDPVKELAAVQQLLGNRHPNIVKILDALQTETHLYYAMPYIAGGDLYGCLLDNMVSSPTGRIEESLAKKWFCQMLSAISHLQKRGVCHRDICLDNMMVDEENNISIIDFGLCLRVPFVDPNNRNLVTDASANTHRRLMKAQGQCGRLEYMAPEVSMRSEAFDGFAIDLWAVGIVLFEILVGKKPFGMPDPVDGNFQRISVEEDLAGLLKAKGIDVSEKAVHLLQKMLRSNPARRPNLSEVVNHPWVQGSGKQVKESIVDVDLDKKWFVKNDSINDGVKSDSICLNELQDDSFFSRMSTNESITVGTSDSTVATSDTESQSRSSPTFSEDPSLCDSFNQNVSLEPQEEEEADVTDEINAQKKRNWLPFRLKSKSTKWKCAGKEKAVE